MSYTYLLERGEESSAECFSDIPACVLSRLNLFAEESFSKDSETESCPSFQSGTMCEHSTANCGEVKSTSSAEDSPAKTSPAQERARELTEQEAGSGLSSQESLAKYDPATRLWRTRQCSLFEGLGECLETFPKSGMMRHGVLWELTMSERLTSEKECGFWRTPDTGAGGVVSDRELEELANGNWKRPSGSQKQLRLQDQVREPRLFPTPTRSDYKGRGPKSKQQGLSEIVKKFYPTPNCSGMDGGSNSRKSNKKRGIHQKLYPTPKCQDSRAALTDRHKSNLGEVVHGGLETLPTKTARLNPNWVEWLMGWPIGWTDLKPLETDKFRSWLQQHLDI